MAARDIVMPEKVGVKPIHTRFSTDTSHRYYDFNVLYINTYMYNAVHWMWMQGESLSMY